MDQRILIIDDDQELCALLREYLELEGFSISAVHDGLQAISHLENNQYDAIVLDIMLPSMQGLDVLRKLRTGCDTPVLMLTAKGDETDRIVGLEMGADDYLPKPCNPRELTARLRAILRRTNAAAEHSASRELQVDSTRLNPADRSASHNGQELDLTSAEFNLLQVLLSHAGEVVDKDTLSQQALGRALAAYDRSVDVHISKIRKKLAGCGGENLIVSIRGIGYQFAVSPGS